MMNIANAKPIKLISLADHLANYGAMVKELGLDKIKFPCKAYLTGEQGNFGIPIVTIPSMNKEYSIRWFESEA